MRVPSTNELLIAYDARGCPRALGARCPHRDLPLAEFARHGRRPGTIVCTAHRCEFDVESGACVASEVREPVPRLLSYRLVPGVRGWLAEITEEDTAR
jgi:nitrite reductase/ring-hydroxylating ferredoxin subunit